MSRLLRWLEVPIGANSLIWAGDLGPARFGGGPTVLVVIAIRGPFWVVQSAHLFHSWPLPVILRPRAAALPHQRLLTPRQYLVVCYGRQ